jgi:hypothetical protein
MDLVLTSDERAFDAAFEAFRSSLWNFMVQQGRYMPASERRKRLEELLSLNEASVGSRIPALVSPIYDDETQF